MTPLNKVKSNIKYGLLVLASYRRVFNETVEESNCSPFCHRLLSEFKIWITAVNAVKPHFVEKAKTRATFRTSCFDFTV